MAVRWVKSANLLMEVMNYVQLMMYLNLFLLNHLYLAYASTGSNTQFSSANIESPFFNNL